MDLFVENICSLNCVPNKEYFNKSFARVLLGQSNEVVLGTFDIEKKSKTQETNERYLLQYSPVGNYTPDPVVIICGKTTSGDSHDLFVNHLQNGDSLHDACFKSIFSNMKDNLFEYLTRINFFEFMQLSNSYWKHGNYKELWDKIFTDSSSSVKSGIQLTQACNCAILNDEKSKRSNEPPGHVFKRVNDKTNCFFNHFRIGPNLKLILFLDTPSTDARFHQVRLWDKSMKYKYPNVTAISITHPSGQNSDVYSYLDDLSKMKNQRKKPNALKLFNNATQTINQLIMETKVKKQVPHRITNG